MLTGSVWPSFSSVLISLHNPLLYIRPLYWREPQWTMRVRWAVGEGMRGQLGSLPFISYKLVKLSVHSKIPGAHRDLWWSRLSLCSPWAPCWEDLHVQLWRRQGGSSQGAWKRHRPWRALTGAALGWSCNLWRGVCGESGLICSACDGNHWMNSLSLFWLMNNIIES